MRRLAVLAALPALAFAAAPGPVATVTARPVAAPAVRLPQPGELGLAEPPDAFTAQRALAGGGVDHAAYLRAMAQADAMAAQAQRSGRRAPAWQLAGPTNIGGRLLDVVVDPTNTSRLFVAAASGGVWVSPNRGKNFAPAWPASLTQAVGALAVSRSGVLWAGTGEAGPGGGSITFGGTGVYRSKDRGRSWQYTGLRTSNRVGRIAVDPKNEQRVFVAATGNLYAAGGDRGLYLTKDGGRSWKRVLAPETPTTGAVDVVIDPVDPRRVYAAMWDNHRQPDRRFYTGLGSGLFRSTDGGETWARIGLPWFAASPALGRIGVAVAPSDHNRVYAVASTESGLFSGFYVSTDGGTTFTPRADVALVNGAYVYGWWFGRLYVDPKNADRVFSTGVDLAETTNGGTTWRVSGSEMHADHHGMAWDPKDPDRVYNGNDGGLYFSEDGGETWDKGDYQPWSQLYSIDVAEKDARRVMAGLQDNGVNRSWDADGEASPGGWNSWVGGDGEAAVINPENHDIVYGCYQYGECFVSTDAGNRSSGFGAEIVASRKNWFSPVVLDPSNPSTVYTGGESLWKSTDDGATWTPIGGVTRDFSNGPGRETNPLFRNYGTITTIATTDVDTGVMMVGTDDGNLWISEDAGDSFTKVVSSKLPKAWITRVAIDLDNPDVLYVAYSGYRSGDNAAHVFRSTDTGATWTDISRGLPGAPVNDVVVVGRDVIVGTDVGVYATSDAGRSWRVVGSGLPRAPVTDIRYHARTQRLYAATFGRSAFWVSYPKPKPNGGARPRSVSASRGGTAAPATSAAVAPAGPAAPAAVAGSGAAAPRISRTSGGGPVPAVPVATALFAALAAASALALRPRRR